jgi:hypothetical protein
MKTKLPPEARIGSELEELLIAQLRYAGLPTPEREFKFSADRGWRLDLVFEPQRVAVEIHGGTWTGGRHVRGGGFQEDRIKINEAQIEGWMVLEFTEKDVRTAAAISVIERALKMRGS